MIQYSLLNTSRHQINMRLSYTEFFAKLLVATVVSEQGVRFDKEDRVHKKHGNAPEILWMIKPSGNVS